MGVPTFFKWICTRYPRCIKDAVEKSCFQVNGRETPVDFEEANPNGMEIDNFYVDMNGIIHPCCHPEDGLAPESEDVMFSNIVQYIDRLIRIVRPQKLLYLAIDGVAPRSKMNQQRARRYRAAQEREEQHAEESKLLAAFKDQGKALPEVRELWDSNVITPGTTFMERVALLLRWYVADRMSHDPMWKRSGLRVVLSDAYVPGEGEHKIMDFIRSQRMQVGYNPNTTHCLYGADADLIMLGLATHEPNFYIIREVMITLEERKCYLCNRVGHQPSDCPGEDAAPQADDDASVDESALLKPFQFICIGILREYLSHQFGRFQQSLPFGYDFERCVDDFVFMCLFVGNDFLPHLPSLSIRDGSVDQMITLYLEILPTLGDYLTDNGVVNMITADVFLEYLGKVEDDVFRLRLQREDKFRSQRQQGQSIAGSQANGRGGDSSGPAKRGPMRYEDANTAQAKKLLLSLAGSGSGIAVPAALLKTLPKPQISAADVTKSTESFYDQVRDKLKSTRDLGDKFQDKIRLGEGGDSSAWKQRYYMDKFKIKTEDMADFILRIRQSYCEGLCWNMLYYYRGCPSWSWYYPYHYAPFASDLVGCDALPCSSPSYFSLGTPFRPLQQLMAVLPPKSAKPAGIPASMSALMTDTSGPLIDFYPSHFCLDLNGKKFLWQAVVLLPFIKEARFAAAVDEALENLSVEVKDRNRLGAPLLFVPVKDCMANQIKAIASHDSVEKTLVDLAFTDTRGNGSPMFGAVSFAMSLEGVKSGSVHSIASPFDNESRYKPVTNPALLVADYRHPETESPRADYVPYRLLDGHRALPAILNPSDLTDAGRWMGFGGEPAIRMLLDVLQRRLQFHTMHHINRNVGPSALSGPPAPGQQHPVGFGTMPRDRYFSSR